MSKNPDADWKLYPIGGDTGQAYIGRREEEVVFLKRNSSPFLAALSSEGITPKLMWTKRVGNGDTLTAQEWLNSRELTNAEMAHVNVSKLLKKIHNSDNLLEMLYRVEGEVYHPQRFLDDFEVDLQNQLRSHSLINEVVAYLFRTMPLVDNQIKRVCHGDIHRNNFLLTDENRLFIVDWEMVKIADPMCDITQLLCQYINFSDWDNWFQLYDMKVTNQVYQRIEWYSLYNLLTLVKKMHRENRYYKMNEKILMLREIYQSRIN